MGLNIKDLIETAGEVIGSLRSFKGTAAQLEQVAGQLLGGLAEDDSSEFELLMLWRNDAGQPCVRAHHGRIHPRQRLDLQFPCHAEYEQMPAGTWIVARGPVVIRLVQLAGREHLLGNGTTLCIVSAQTQPGYILRVMVEGQS